MPYGSNYPKRTTGNVTQYWKDGAASPIYVNPFTVAGVYSAHGKVSYVRSGTKAPAKSVKASVVKRKKDGPFVWRLVTVYKGKRLATKRYDPILKKNVFNREPIQVWRLVQTYKKTQTQKSKKGMNIPPNALNYQSTMNAYFGDDLVVTSSNGSSPTSKLMIMSGCLWAPFLPYGASFVPGVNADNYTGTTILNPKFSQAVTRADQVATARLYERVKDQSVNLAQALVEYRQTAQLFVSLARTIFKFWVNLKKGKLLQAMDSLIPNSGKQLASNHLAIQYGVLPLLSDLDGIVEHLAGKDDVEFDIIVRRREEIPYHLSTSAMNVLSGTIRFKDEVYSQGYVEVKYKYRFRISSPKMAVERLTAQLGFGNLNSLAWETLPFSFVVDWFLPIGNFLNTADAFTGLTVLSSTKTVFQKETLTFRRTFGGNNSGMITSSGSCGFVSEKVSCVRSLISAPPTLRFPELKDPISKMHIANAIALLTQLRK